MSINNQRKLRSSRLVSEINVVPYIDVMLVLLVIFMVSTPLLTEGVYVDLPEAKGESIQTASELDRVVVSIDKTGQVFVSINGSISESVDRKALALQVKKQLQRNNNTEFYVKGDRATPYGKVVTLMATLQYNGVPNVGLITKASELDP